MTHVYSAIEPDDYRRNKMGFTAQLDSADSAALLPPEEMPQEIETLSKPVEENRPNWLSRLWARVKYDRHMVWKLPFAAIALVGAYFAPEYIKTAFNTFQSYAAKKDIQVAWTYVREQVNDRLPLEHKLNLFAQEYPEDRNYISGHESWNRKVHNETGSQIPPKKAEVVKAIQTILKQEVRHEAQDLGCASVCMDKEGTLYINDRSSSGIEIANGLVIQARNIEEMQSSIHLAKFLAEGQELAARRAREGMEQAEKKRAPQLDRQSPKGRVPKVVPVNE